MSDAAKWHLISSGLHPTEANCWVATLLMAGEIYTMELSAHESGGLIGGPDERLGDIMERVLDGDPATDEERAIANGADDFMNAIASEELKLSPPITFYDSDVTPSD